MKKHYFLLVFCLYGANISLVAAQKDAPNYAIVKEKVQIQSAYRKNETLAPTWKTVQTQFLVCPAHNEGSTFFTSNAYLPTKTAYSTLTVTPAIWDEKTYTIVTRQACGSMPVLTETYKRRTLVQPEAVTESNTLGEYKIIRRKSIDKSGTGALIPAEYITIEQQVIDAPPMHRVSDMPAQERIFEVQLCRSTAN